MIEEEKALRLLLRQLTDIQEQANKIISGDNSAATFENLARYSNELKDYIDLRVKNEDIKSYSKEIPNINYSKVNLQLWEFLILPMWWWSVYKDYMLRRNLTEQVHLLRNKYAGLEFLIRGMG